MRDQQVLNLLNQSSDLICKINENLEVSWANNAFFKTLGWLKSDILNQKFLNFIAAEDQNNFLHYVNNTLTKPFSFNCSCLHKNGTTVLIEFKAQKDIDANSFYLVGSQSASVQKSGEELFLEEKKYRSLVENSTNGIAILQADGSTSFVSPSVVNILGYPEKEAIKMNLSDILHPDDAPKVFLSISEALNNPGVPILGNLSRIKRKDGSWIWVEATITNLLHDPAINGIVDDFKDVTNAKTATEHLEQSKNDYKKLFNFSPIPKFIYQEGNYKILQVNEAAIKHYGYSRDEFMKMSVLDLRPMKDRHLVDLIHKNIEDKSGLIQFGTNVHQRKDGSVCKMEILGQKLTYNHTNCIIAAADDVTEKELLHGMEQLEREIMSKSIQLDFDLKILLKEYVLGLESLFHGMYVSILKVRDNKIYNYISPSLPNAYLKKINGEPIGKNAGSCGTAAYKKKKVVVEDISIDSLWANYKSIAIKNNLKSCWSQPIFNAKKEVVATFANYYSSIKSPSKLELELFDRSAALLSLLFEHYQKSKDLLSSNERFNYINKVTNDVLYDWDVEKDIFNWSESFQRVFGHKINRVFRLKNWVELMHHEDDAILSDKWENFIQDKKENRWVHEFRFQKEDGSFAFVEEIGYLVRDKKGRAIRMYGVVRDRTTQKIELLQNQLLEEVSLIFNKSISISETLTNVLDHLNHYAEFCLSEAWLIDHDHSHISLISTAINFEKGSLFYNESKSSCNFLKGEGLPGIVWKGEKPVIWEDLGNSTSFKRHKAAKKAGLLAGLGLPIFDNKILIGVLIFGVNDEKHKLQHYKKFLAPLGNRLGIEIIRKKAEEELHMFFHYSPDILCIAAQNGRFRKVNPAFGKLLGYTEEEITSQPFTNFIPETDQVNSLLEYNGTIKGERQVEEFINRYLTKAGAEKWISWNSSQVFGAEGLVFAYGRDITEKKELQDLLDQANQLAQIGGWEYDLDTKNIYWSSITRSIHEVHSQYNPTLAETMEFYKAGAHKNKLLEAINRAIEMHEKWDLECIIITANKKEKWVRTIGEPEIKDGKCTKIVGSFQDINKYKKLELRLKSVSDNIPGVIFQYKMYPDGSDQLQFISKGSTEIWGMSPEECEENNELIWRQIESGGELSKVRESIKVSMQNETSWKCEWRSIHPDGTQRWHKGQGSPQKQSDGTTIWDSLIIDVTEKKELEFLVERSSQMARIGSWEMFLKSSLNHSIFWSSMARNIFEVGQDFEVAYSDAIAFFKGESQQQLEEALAELIDDDISFDLELLIETAKGNEKWTRCIGQSERLDGKCIKIFGSIQDIHERKVAELDFQKIFRERNSILENISDGFFSVDTQWTVKYWNEKAELLLHTAKQDILDKCLWDVFDESAGSYSRENYIKAMEFQQPVYFDDYYEPINSWFEISAYPSENGLSVFFKDITDKKKSEELIKQSNERFEMIAQATNDAIWDNNLEENTVFWGQGFEELFGYDLSTINPSRELLMNLIHPEDRDRVKRKMQISFANSKSMNWREEYKFRKKDGSYAFVIDRAIFLRNEQGEAVRILGAMTDISYRKEYEESLKSLNAALDVRAKELTKSNEELEQFAYVASHDLQEPLRMVTSFMNLLNAKYGNHLDEKAHQYIHYAVDGAERMRQIILDLLEFSRAGKTEDDHKKEKISNIVSEACALQRKAIQDKKGKILINEMPDIEVHKMPFLQVFQNLIGNAIKYTRKGVIPEISISCSSSKSSHTIIIKDNGIGIDKTQFDKIFIIFKRLHTKDEFKGTGMGLAIVKKIIENYGGKIWLESEPNKGSTFYFTIPRK